LANGLPDHPFSIFSVSGSPGSCEHASNALAIMTVK
jgi:hypothetical protein